MNVAETAKLIGQVLILFPNANIEPSKLTIDMWHAVLKDSDFEQSSQKLIEYAQEGKPFAPSPGQLFIKKDPYDPLYDHEVSKKYLAKLEDMNKAAERMTPEQKENVAHAKRSIEQLLNIKSSNL